MDAHLDVCLWISCYLCFVAKSVWVGTAGRESNAVVSRGRPWRYSVIPSTPDFPTEYQIRRNSIPAGLPVFAAIWGPDFKASIIILTNMFKQIKQIRITLMTMFKVNPSPPNEVH